LTSQTVCLPITLSVLPLNPAFPSLSFLTTSIFLFRRRFPLSSHCQLSSHHVLLTWPSCFAFGWHFRTCDTTQLPGT
jgi:hypothetical protein